MVRQAIKCLTMYKFSAKLFSVRKNTKGADKEMPRSALLAWLRLARVFQKIDRASVVLLRPWDLNVAQFDVLTQVGSSQGITQQELADRLLVTKGNISQLLDRMERLGLLKRCQEGRTNTLILTETGQRL